ncbi:MAG: hypothetical protein AAB676_04280, partial [Verrucomicrobiota bacterium]
MHPDLEALIQAYDAALEASPKEAARRRDEFEQRLQEVLSRARGVSEESLHNVIRLAHRRWLAKQRKPPTMPPK